MEWEHPFWRWGNLGLHTGMPTDDMLAGIQRPVFEDRHAGFKTWALSTRWKQARMHFLLTFYASIRSFWLCGGEMALTITTWKGGYRCQEGIASNLVIAVISSSTLRNGRFLLIHKANCSLSHDLFPTLGQKRDQNQIWTNPIKPRIWISIFNPPPLIWIFPGPEFLLCLNFQHYDLVLTSWAALNPHSRLNILTLLQAYGRRRPEFSILYLVALWTHPHSQQEQPWDTGPAYLLFQFIKKANTLQCIHLPTAVTCPWSSLYLRPKGTVKNSCAQIPCDQGPQPRASRRQY